MRRFRMGNGSVKGKLPRETHLMCFDSTICDVFSDSGSGSDAEDVENF